VGSAFAEGRQRLKVQRNDDRPSARFVAVHQIMYYGKYSDRIAVRFNGFRNRFKPSLVKPY
jgi:hypothetical protein